MAHIDLAAPVSHIWFFKGVPSRIGYLIDMAPKELEKVLYFAASIVTSIDEEARAKDVPKLEKEVNKVLDSYKAEREQRVQELGESLERRLEYIGDGDKPAKFSEEDELWAEAIGSVKKLNKEDRTKLERETRKELNAEIADTEAYIDDAIERMEDVWKTFQEMKVKDVIADEAHVPRAQGPLRLPVRLGRVLHAAAWARSRSASCSARSTSRPSARSSSRSSTPRRARSRPAR